MATIDPKIELHVHLEGSVRPAALLRIARRNNLALPVDDEAELARLFTFRDFEHFVELWLIATNVIRTADDFREIVVAYASEAATHGCVYMEAIFTPAERVAGGASWTEVFEGFCDGAEQARAETEMIVRFTPDIPRGCDLDVAHETVRHAARYRDRGVVGVGLGGLEAQFPPEPYAPVFRVARDLGLGSVPHAGEVAGPASIRGALDALGADRLRHGIRAVEDPVLLRELADRGVVCDVCPISNVRTGAVSSLAEHPLPALVAARVPCSISTDDPAMFDTDLGADHAAAAKLGHGAEAAYRDALRGVLCTEDVRAHLRDVGRAHGWAS